MESERCSKSGEHVGEVLKCSPRALRFTTSVMMAGLCSNLIPIREGSARSGVGGAD